MNYYDFCGYGYTRCQCRENSAELERKTKYLDHIKEEYKKSDLVMSEFLRNITGLSITDKAHLLAWSGDDEFMRVTDTGDIVTKEE